WTAWTYYLHRKLRTWQLVDRFIVLTDFSRQLFLSSNKQLTAEQLVVKPNFVDVSTGGRHEGDYYVFVGRLSAEKGILPLVDAMAGSSYKLKIIGDGPLMETVQEKVRNCDNIELLGRKNREETMLILGNSKA